MAAKDTEVIVIDDPAEDEEEDTKGTVNSNEGKLLQLPITRVKTIMKSSPDIGPVSQEAYFLIAKCAVSRSTHSRPRLDLESRPIL